MHDSVLPMHLRLVARLVAYSVASVIHTLLNSQQMSLALHDFPELYLRVLSIWKRNKVNEGCVLYCLVL